MKIQDVFVNIDIINYQTSITHFVIKMTKKNPYCRAGASFE